MHKSLLLILFFTVATLVCTYGESLSDVNDLNSTTELAVYSAEEGNAEANVHHHAPAWSVIPFVVLLLMIATGPLFYENFWHKSYPKIAVLLAVLVVGYYIFCFHNNVFLNFFKLLLAIIINQFSITPINKYLPNWPELSIIRIYTYFV